MIRHAWMAVSSLKIQPKDVTGGTLRTCVGGPKRIGGPITASSSMTGGWSGGTGEQTLLGSRRH